MRILIADDNEDARLILRRTLESNGYHVEEAENGGLALEKARLNPPDMIISDILMPVMDGFMLCREVRLDKALRDIPFLFYSANYTDEQDEKLAFEMGADRFIRKPVDPADFLDEITSAMTAIKKGRFHPVLPHSQDDAIFKLYSERLVNKLESKMQELEQEMIMRKETEQDLRFFRFLADQSNDAYFVIDSDTGRFLDVNRKACENLGYNRKELLKKTVVDIEALLPDMEAWNHHVAQVRQTGDMLMEGEHRRKDCSLLPVEINVRTLAHQGSEYLVAVARDIRKQKKVQQTLRESEEKYRSLVESSSDHIFMLSPDGVYLESNDRVAQFGMNKGSDLIGKRLEDVYGEDAGEYFEKLNLLATSQTALRFGHRLTISSGRLIEHEDTLYPILRDGRLWAIGGICRDVTEQK
ncbi:MAG: PAS domain S-box protein, partial [Desulfatirhabdiaceae bacterium]|nr:PAS domain S-box protein [Desulfatirhabdiaceae bacterium]